MEDRLDALGGTLQIESTPGAGTTVRASSHQHACGRERLTPRSATAHGVRGLTSPQPKLPDSCWAISRDLAGVLTGQYPPTTGRLWSTDWWGFMSGLPRDHILRLRLTTAPVSAPVGVVEAVGESGKSALANDSHHLTGKSGVAGCREMVL
jgi:hypothetical protein